jgi:hypothetical protein
VTRPSWEASADAALAAIEEARLAETVEFGATYGAVANAHATLALASSQHTANLLAFATHAADRNEMEAILTEVRERLGR